MQFLAFAAVLAGVLAAGRGVVGAAGGAAESRSFRVALDLAAGLLLVHVALAWLDLIGLRWRLFPVVAVVAAAAAIPAFLRRRSRRGAAASVARYDPGGADPPLRLGWAGLVGAGVVAWFALLAVSERITFPDFVYHWGIKGHRYFLAGGIDYDFLGADWNLVAHRDYPQLVPELYALQSSVVGRFAPPALLLWSAVFFAALLVAARQGLAAGPVRRDRARAVFALLALAIGVFAVGYLMAGSVDWIVAFALAAAVPALLRPPDARGELELGLLGALAAASKLEGLPLAGILALVGLARRARFTLAADQRRRAGRGDAVRALGGAVLRLLGPSLLAVLPWAIQGLRHDLFRDPQGGAFDPGRAPEIARALWQAMLRPEWHLVPLVLLLVPVLFLTRDTTRAVGAVVTLQLAGYLLRYFTASFDYVFSVLSSFPRLAFHLVPAVVVGLAVAVERRTTRSRGSGRA